jgi:hypothetical protein
VREAADEVDLAHELLDLVLLQAVEPDALHRDHLAGGEVERAVHRA